MKASTATALRANLVLCSVSIAIAVAPCISLASLISLFDDSMPTLPYQGSIFLLAALIMLVLRWGARRAFDAARQAHKVQLIEKHGLEAWIDDDCPFAWLVQMHVELHGHQCIN
ncbi:hypothetical protein WN982_26965 [Paraburkholderia sp. IMGN_8]|uniref:hypothetical protein n=1 Tax=Paraburkholderia sp. IMGN_8 TaxID=3136564 RepID=UPI0031013A09